MLDMSEYAPAMYDGGMPTDYIIKFCDHHKGLSNKKVGLGYKCRDACENPCQGTKCGEDLCTNCLWFFIDKLPELSMLRSNVKNLLSYATA